MSFIVQVTIILIVYYFFTTSGNGLPFEVEKITADNYGPYTLEYGKLKLCEGPKQKTSAYTKVNIYENDTSRVLEFNFNFTEKTTVNEIRMTVYTLKNNRRYVLWNYKVLQPCQHFLYGKMFEDMVHDRSCIIPKEYSFRVNYTQSEHVPQFFGSSFFYGTYLFKVYVFSRNSNILCVNFILTFKKK